MYTPLPFTQVQITDEFWAPKIRINREVTLPIEYQQCQSTGRIDAFHLNWQAGAPNPPHVFWDSDVAKWIEAASYSLVTHPDPALGGQLDEVIALIAQAQQSDGYLNTHFTVVEPGKRWMNLRDAHELYCAGHLIEAAVAHFQATGKRTLLDVLCRYADHIASIFGPGTGQKRGYCGHPEIELALVKLAQVTGDPKYLSLARYFVDERGQTPNYFAVEHANETGLPLPWGPIAADHFDYTYNQSHQPVREQRTVTGHAVRAMYLYSAMADLVATDTSLQPALHALWEDVCTRKLYITGGIGSSRHNEGFTHPYDLPNETAYAETCAAIGLVFWNHRLLQLECDARYTDVMERALYNGVISGVSLDGRRFLYENPLASLGTFHRQDWFDCACCPPNIARLLASLGNYIYSQAESVLAVHLYVQGGMQTHLDGQQVTLHQETRYPWNGRVTVRLEVENPVHFTLSLRVPGWCRRYQLHLNGAVLTAPQHKGYLQIERQWQTGDTLTLNMDMPIERIYAHPNVRQDAGAVTLQRGPIVYCLEACDLIVPLEYIYLPKDAALSHHFEADLLGGVTVLTGQAVAAVTRDWEGELYRSTSPQFEPVQLRAVPYYAWDNRQPGSMRVWLTEKP